MVTRGVDRPPPFTQTVPDVIRFEGGYDTETPPLQMPKGRARMAQNYEALPLCGYRRIGGYERYDGRPSPSDATYAVLAATITGAWAAGNTLTGATSGATGVIATAVDDGSGSEYFVLTKVAGTFAAAENLTIGGTTRAVATDSQVQGGASTSLLDAQYENLAADVYRADIAEVPGSGEVLGVCLYEDVLYAWRNNAGGTAAVMHKETSSGWTAVALGYELRYVSGNAELTEGVTVTGATSGATATLARQTLRTGSYGASSAQGSLFFAATTGTFSNGENLQVGGVTKAVASGASAAITLQPSGRFEFVVKNFGNGRRLYGVDRANPGFEFDGTTYVRIRTGMTLDTPNHVREHKNHLFYAFEKSVQHSSPGAPYAWSVVLGASEIAMGDTVTGFMNQAGSEGSKGAMMITSRNKLAILYGSSSGGSDPWDLTDYDQEAGAYAHSVQHVGLTVMMDDRGLTSMQTSANYGNFSTGTLTQQVQTWINTQRPKTRASCVMRDKSQYRVFFTDQYALYVTFDGRKIRGMMPVYFEHAVACVWAGEMSDGTEAAFFGSTNGFVYQMEKGTSFDGDEIEAWLYLALNHANTPRNRKRYKHGLLEMQGDGYAELQVSADLSYGSSDMGQPINRTLTTSLSASFWDAAGAVWDVGAWDPQSALPLEFTLEGTGRNLGLKVYSNSDYYAPLTLTGAILDYSPRRRLR